MHYNNSTFKKNLKAKLWGKHQQRPSVKPKKSSEKETKQSIEEMKKQLIHFESELKVKNKILEFFQRQFQDIYKELESQARMQVKQQNDSTLINPSPLNPRQFSLPITVTTNASTSASATQQQQQQQKQSKTSTSKATKNNTKEKKEKNKRTGIFSFF